MAERAAQERRAAAREQRRAKTEQPADAAADAVEGGPSIADPAEALRTAASAALAGAAVGAAQALARRRHDAPEGEEQQEAPDEMPQPAAEGQTDDVAPGEPEPTRPRRDDEARPSGPRRGTSPEEARRLVQRARDQLRDLRGADAESVSSIKRIDDGWRIGLEVVEVHRIPESTDVLATYEVDLDGDGNLITFERTARYHRSEADRR
ncbi:MAG TPA: gas vesicle protein [Gaiellaceae bacterium]|nr:gas vesicle protein [Gaiellaceae bacterium]